MKAITIFEGNKLTKGVKKHTYLSECPLLAMQQHMIDKRVKAEILKTEEGYAVRTMLKSYFVFYE